VCDVVHVFLASEGQPKAPKQVQVWIGIANGVEIHVRPISMSESGGLGVDRSGRFYWDGKPVEIIGQRLDLTWPQFLVAILIMIFTGIAALLGNKR
jgi:hypothetical protein